MAPLLQLVRVSIGNRCSFLIVLSTFQVKGTSQKWLQTLRLDHSTLYRHHTPQAILLGLEGQLLTLSLTPPLLFLQAPTQKPSTPELSRLATKPSFGTKHSFSAAITVSRTTWIAICSGAGTRSSRLTQMACALAVLGRKAICLRLMSTLASEEGL